jgi:hypothetical protein
MGLIFNRGKNKNELIGEGIALVNICKKQDNTPDFIRGFVYGFLSSEMKKSNLESEDFKAVESIIMDSV